MSPSVYDAPTHLADGIVRGGREQNSGARGKCLDGLNCSTSCGHMVGEQCAGISRCPVCLISAEWLCTHRPRAPNQPARNDGEPVATGRECHIARIGQCKLVNLSSRVDAVGKTFVGMRVESARAIQKSTPMIRLWRQPDAADVFWPHDQGAGPPPDWRNA
jgi:hypothetical protein